MSGRWRRRLGAALLAGPLGLGLALTVFGDWRYQAGLEAGLLIFLGSASLGAVVAMARGRPLPVSRGRYSIDLNRRHWLWIPVFLAVGLGCSYEGGTLTADWFVPGDSIPVVIAAISHSRTGDTVHSDHGRFTTPWFFGFDPDPDLGPATLVVGHFSHVLLRVEEPAGP